MTSIRRVLPVVAPSAFAALVLLSPERAVAAEDVPDIQKLVGFIRPSGVLLSALVVGASLVALRFVAGGAERLGQRFANRRPLIQKVESITRFFIYFATVTLCLLLSLRVDQEVLKYVGGGLAVAIGFALRDLVAAFIAGLMIMFDRPFQVGDRVQYAGEYGDILQIGLRSVRMCTLDDNIVTIPNNKVLTDVTSSGNYGALDMMVVMSFYIGIDQDVDLAERLVKESILSSRYVFLDKPIVVLVTQVIEKAGYPAIHLKGKAYVLDVKYEKAFETDVNKRVIAAFAKHGVRPPAMIHRFEGPNGEPLPPRLQPPAA
ncbi:MAG: mechanosensitive ion channel [Polyangiaceae bacterium]